MEGVKELRRAAHQAVRQAVRSDSLIPQFLRIFLAKELRNLGRLRAGRKLDGVIR